MTARCPCGGSDDYCVCQNVDLAALREQQKETAKDTYFAIAEYKTRIDWFEGELAKADEWKAHANALEAQVAALTAERDEARHHYDCVVVSWAECRQRAEKAECHEDAQRSTISMLTDRAERAEADRDRLALELSQAKQLIERLIDAALKGEG